MATFADSLKREIARIARRELKGELASLRKTSAAHRSEIAALKRDLKSLQSENKDLARRFKAGAVRSEAAVQPRPSKVPTKRGRKVLYSAELFASMRSKLGITQVEMSRLLSVSALSVHKWESGQVEPREKQKAKILELRSLGKREAAKLLASSV
jgi:DNA-binding transcriptional regulator YiaG